MSEPFDPYRKWLGIPPKDQPPNHYRLLGIAHFEEDPDVIEGAATRQMSHVRTFQSGKYSALSQKILNELTAAKLCLLQRDKKGAYDEQLRARLAAEGKLSSDNLPRPTAHQPAEEDRDSFPIEAASAGAARRSTRWKTDTESTPPPEPPIVPIPMPMGTAVASAAPPMLAPSLPVASVPLVYASRARSSYRQKRRKSVVLPIAIMVFALLILVAGGSAALVYSGVMSKHFEKHPAKKSTPAARSLKSEI